MKLKELPELFHLTRQCLGGLNSLAGALAMLCLPLEDDETEEERMRDIEWAFTCAYMTGKWRRYAGKPPSSLLARQKTR